VVANRHGDVTGFKVPADEKHGELFLEPCFMLAESKQTKIQNPGSVDIYRHEDGAYRMLVCNNHLHTVTSHTLKGAEDISVSGHRVLVRKKLIIPDGLTVSPDKQWIAVSNHVTGELIVYRNTLRVNRFSAPVAVLGGIVCPHGVRFSSDGRRLIVADAASAYLHLFERDGEAWHSQSAPTKSVRLLSKSQFEEGRTNPEEGGVKGLDMTRDGKLLVTTCELDTLAFYTMDIFENADTPDIGNEIAGLSADRDAVLTTNIYATAKRHFWQ
ncbi:MAG: YncE family protein, partial [Halioglobus sp.]